MPCTGKSKPVEVPTFGRYLSFLESSSTDRRSVRPVTITQLNEAAIARGLFCPNLSYFFFRALPFFPPFFFPPCFFLPPFFFPRLEEARFDADFFAFFWQVSFWRPS